MKIDEVKIMATQDEIVKRIQKRKANDFLGEEIPRMIGFLDYDHAKEFLKEDVTREQWDNMEAETDLSLQNSIAHYLEWWGQKVRDGRGISVHRGKGFVANLLFIAGIPLYKELDDDDGGYYQQEAYAKFAELFDHKPVFAPSQG